MLPLSQEIQKSYNTLVKLISTLSPQKKRNKCIEGTGGLVSVNDLIAYQIGWGQLLITWYQSGLKNQQPQMPGEGFSTWDYVGLAKHFYQKYLLDGGPKQMALFDNTVKEILSIIDTEGKNHHLNALGIWTWCTLKSGKAWPLSKWIRINTVAPYKRAIQLIKKMTKACP